MMFEKCECRKCKPQDFWNPRQIVCEKCGTKRCPRAHDCDFECDGGVLIAYKDIRDRFRTNFSREVS